MDDEYGESEQEYGSENDLDLIKLELEDEKRWIC